jgi:S-DNA-T family DNA segregation ATPase FtsK/SpoIIIE
MLYLPPGTGLPQRVHGAFVADHEVHNVVEHLKRLAAPEYIEAVVEPAVASDAGGAGEGGGEKDPLYDQAVEIVLRTRRPSISLVQRHLRIGYNRAARLIEDMERAGLVSSMQSNGNREVLVPATQE